MSKRRKSNNPVAKQQHNEANRPKKSRKWREIRRFAIVFGLLATVVGTGLAAFKYSYDINHDLSQIGQGIPAVVQIHDTSCALCNQLRRNASSAADRFGDRLLYRIADIDTAQGRQLQLRHEVPHVTLLLFDGKGELQRVLTGVKSSETLYRAFEAHLKRFGKTESVQN